MDRRWEAVVARQDAALFARSCTSMIVAGLAGEYLAAVRLVQRRPARRLRRAAAAPAGCCGARRANAGVGTDPGEEGVEVRATIHGSMNCAWVPSARVLVGRNVRCEVGRAVAQAEEDQRVALVQPIAGPAVQGVAAFAHSTRRRQTGRTARAVQRRGNRGRIAAVQPVAVKAVEGIGQGGQSRWPNR